MRRTLALLVVAGGLAGLAATIGSSSPVTHDVLPVLVPPRGDTNYEIVFGTDALGGTPLPSLAAFRRRATSGDLVPAPWRVFEQAMHADGAQSRRLLSIRGVQIFAFPGPDHQLCYLRVPPTSGSSCIRSFLDGAYPQVNAWHDAWGIVDDETVRVEVDGMNAILAENAFYSSLPANTPTPHRIVVYERSGLRHVYDIKPCPVGGRPVLC